MTIIHHIETQTLSKTHKALNERKLITESEAAYRTAADLTTPIALANSIISELDSLNIDKNTLELIVHTSMTAALPPILKADLALSLSNTNPRFITTAIYREQPRTLN